MMPLVTFLHIKDNAWVGIYIDGKKLANGYFNVQELAKAEEAFYQWGGYLGFTIERLEKPQKWFTELGGVLPDRIGVYFGEIKSQPEQISGIRYYKG